MQGLSRSHRKFSDRWKHRPNWRPKPAVMVQSKNGSTGILISSCDASGLKEDEDSDRRWRRMIAKTRLSSKGSKVSTSLVDLATRHLMVHSEIMEETLEKLVVDHVMEQGKPRILPPLHRQ